MMVSLNSSKNEYVWPKIKVIFYLETQVGNIFNEDMIITSGKQEFSYKQ